MPIGGETIGDAYVRILADGDGLDRSIRDEFRENDNAIKGEGRRHGEVYNEAMAKELKSAPSQRRLRDSITEALAKQDFLDEKFFRSPKWQDFRKRMTTRFGEVGRVAGQNLERELQEGMDFGTLKNRLNNITGELAKATRQIQQAELSALRTQSAERDAEFEHSIRLRASLLESLSKRYDDIIERTDRMTRGEDFAHGVRHRTIEDLHTLVDDYKRAGIATKDWTEESRHLEERLRFMHPTLNKHSTAIGAIADRVGAAFGRGSRNDFINIIGGVARGFVNLGQIVPGIAKKVLDFGQTIKFAFDESLRNNGSVFRATMAGVAAALETAGAAVVAFAAAAAGAVIFVGPLVALVSLLAGVLTALSSTVIFGAIGAFGALAGALAPVVAGVGALALGLASIDWKREGKEAQGLIDGVKKLGSALGKGLLVNVPDIKSSLAPVLRSLRPIAFDIGNAMSDVISGFARSLDSPGFRRFTDAMGRRLPTQIRQIGRIFDNVFAGIGHVILALQPITGRFLDWLEDITGEFRKWSGTQAGHKELVDFFDRAADSASSLGHFLKGAYDLLTTLLSAGQGTGDDIFTQMGDALEGFSRDLGKDPEQLRRWFRDAKHLADQIGHLIIDIGKLFDAFDDENTRSGALLILGAIGGSLRALGAVARVAAASIRVSLHAIGQMVDFVKDAWNAAKKLFHGGSLFPNRALLAAPFVGLVGRIASLMQPLVGRVQRIFSNVVGDARDGASRMRNAFTGTGGKIAALIQPMVGRVSQIMGSAAANARQGAANIVNAFRGVAGRIGGLLSGITGAVRDALSGAAGAARDAVSHIVDAFRGLAGRIIAAVGTIHLPTPTIHMPSIPKIHIPGTAVGGLFNGAQIRLIGEAGPEAVVPLRRPLAQVDPAVRALSAIAQGLKIPQTADGGVVGRATIDASGWQIVTPGADSRAVATQVVNELAARGY
jgi:hypothetical protein